MDLATVARFQDPYAAHLAKAALEDAGVQAFVSDDHWVLDVVFGEDRSRARERNSGANLSSVRRLAHNLIKNEKQYGEWSVKKRKFAASQDPEYLLKLLGQGASRPAYSTKTW